MSEEQLKAFLEAVKADAGLQEQLKAAGDADAVVAIAKAAGFVISADDLKKAQAEVSDEELVLLSDEGLKGVAGGWKTGREIVIGVGCDIEHKEIIIKSPDHYLNPM